MIVCFLGNYAAPHSTENHVARAWEANGHEVVRVQEREGCWADIRDLAVHRRPDLVMWTRTGSLDQDTNAEKVDSLGFLAARQIPTVGFHLDRWWGLDREEQIGVEPFFQCDLVVTADGGHDVQWAASGVNHRWLPPAVSAADCVPAAPQARFRADVAFVGSWRPGYHREWQHRVQLVSFLRRTYRRQARFWPEDGKPAVRGDDLRALYASTKVNVGDSCLVPAADGTPMTRYWSDRIPETLGRGGFLVHPEVGGLDEHYTPGKHLVTWPLGDWPELRRLIDHYLHCDGERQAIAEAGRAYVLATATYEIRVRQVLDLLCDDGLLDCGQVAA